jgi:signal transduction histidine kinase
MEQNATRPVLHDSGLSHDLLNELMIVIGLCDLLQEEFPEYQYSKHVHAIREAAKRMSQRVTGCQAGCSLASSDGAGCR